MSKELTCDPAPAPVQAPELMEWLSSMLQVPINEGYGMTEVGWVTNRGHIVVCADTFPTPCPCPPHDTAHQHGDACTPWYERRVVDFNNVVLSLPGQDNVTAWKLRDVPELGYHTFDKPHPRGELLVITKAIVPGYFKHEKVRCPLRLSHRR